MPFAKESGLPPFLREEFNLRDLAYAGDLVFVVTPATTTRAATSAAWTRDVIVELKSANGEVHTWFDKAITSGCSIADTSSAGTATIPSTTLTFTNGRAVVTVTGSAHEWRAGTLQVETATVVGTVTGSGNATVTITSPLVTGSPLAIDVAVLEDDTASDVAGKIRTALNNTSAVTTHYTVGGATTAVILTAKVVAANDATLNIAIDSGTCTGLTAAPTSANTTAGVAKDTNTFTVAEATIAGTVVATKTSVETIV